jgi:hypothetical protein
VYVGHELDPSPAIPTHSCYYLSLFDEKEIYIFGNYLSFKKRLSFNMGIYTKVGQVPNLAGHQTGYES